MIVCGLVNAKLTLTLIDCWLKSKHLPLIVSAGMCVSGNGSCTLSVRR